jgi:hypothetical protein
MGTSSCALFLDAAYVLGGKTYTVSAEQRKRSGLDQTSVEPKLALVDGHVRVVCAEVTRSVERIWNETKTYEHQGGLHLVHLLPLLTEGPISAALAVGTAVGAVCGDPAASSPCVVGYFAIPLAIDAVYALIRLLTIEPAKLVDKKLGSFRSELGATPNRTVATTCPAAMEMEVIARSYGGFPKLAVDEGGGMTLDDQRALNHFVMNHQESTVAVWTHGDQASPDLTRCAFMALMNWPASTCTSPSRPDAR